MDDKLIDDLIIEKLWAHVRILNLFDNGITLFRESSNKCINQSNRNMSLVFATWEIKLRH